MDRRDALKVILGTAGLAGPAMGAEWIINPYVEEFGASRPVQVTPDRKSFHRVFRPFKGVSGALDKNVFLFHNLQKELRVITPHDQRSIKNRNGKIIRLGEGDCIGQAGAMGCDILAATEIHLLGDREVFEAKASVEMIYAGSRIEIGKEDNPHNRNKQNWMKGKAGSYGVWAARYLKEYGVLHRKRYSKRGGEFIDLTGYHPNRSRKYRDAGVPDWLEDVAREHPVREITNIHSGAEALDAVCAGQPVLMCSTYAFHNRRDAEGFCAPYLGMGWVKGQKLRYWGRVKQWWHAMILTGAILEGKRKGGIIQNSVGNWNSGPRPYDMPVGSFGVDVHVLDRMVKDWFDCYALASYKGHDAEKIKHRLYL